MDFQKIYENAIYAGIVAANKATPVPMVVTYNGKKELIADGVCGFAYVEGIATNSNFGKWLLSTGNGSKGFKKGVELNPKTTTQSFERNKANASAVAAYLMSVGIGCRVKAYMD